MESHSGAYKGHITGYKCPRCAKSQGYLFFGTSGAMYFCGDRECLQNDSDASKGQRKETKFSSQQDAAMTFSVGSRYLNASLSKCSVNPQINDRISSWLRKPKNMMVITGKVKTGKTYHCMAIANYLLDQQKSISYLVYRKYFEELQKYIQKSESSYDFIEKLNSVDYLIIDDVGASLNTDWQKEVFFDLIDRRYSSEKPTIITTNWNEKECLTHLGERTSRRLFDSENLVLTFGPEYGR
jgi:DNA replication protein DnaC